jgi:hypothetical protein
VTVERLAAGERQSGVAPSGWRRVWTLPRPTTAILVLVVCLLAMQVRDLLSYSQWLTDEDQTLLWFAGRDLLHLQLHSPNVLGANYNTVFEALPGAVLAALGVPVRIASPLGVAAMATAAWLLLALTAYRRGQSVSAALALAWPVCMSLPYLLAYDQLKGVQTGDLIAACAVAASIGVKQPHRRLALGVALAGVAFIWDNASVIATGPALMAVIGSEFGVLRQQPRRSLVTLACAALLPLALLVGNHLWYSAHPGYVVSPPVDTSLHLSVLWRHLLHPTPLFGIFAPELARSPWTTLVWIVGVLAGALWVARITRRVEPAMAALGFIGVLTVVLSVADTGWNFQANVYLTGGRFMFLMPMGAWVVAYYTLVAARESERGLWPHMLRRLHVKSATAIGAIALVALVSTAVAQASFRSQLKPLIASAAGPGAAVQLRDAPELLSECAAVTPLYHQYRAQILVSMDQPFAYGCATESGLNTLFPPYDRRPWLVHAAYTKPVRRVLLWGGINCQQPPLKPGVGVCTPLAAGAELLVTPPRPVASTLARMGWTVYRRRH